MLAPYPLVRLLIPLAFGITIGAGFAFGGAFLICWGIISLAGIFATYFLLKKSSAYYPLNGLFIFIFFLTAGIALFSYHQNVFEESKAEIVTDVPVMIRIAGDPETKENNVRCVAEITAVLQDSLWKPVNAQTMLYVKRTAASEQLMYGDELLVMPGVKTPSPTLNPGEFDYAGWLKHRGIGFVSFAKEGWELKSHSEPSWIKARALQLRKYFRERMVICGLTGQELAVSEALLLGQSSEIDPQLLSSYSASGTLHVLSVSGMHVALVFVVLLKILAPLDKKKKGKWLSFAIQFFVIWFYAFMTGMSPSVLRSVMMLSVIITGRIINRKGHLLNTLAASAIILLLGDPMLLQDAGFLLSYCAVAGIVLVQPFVESWWSPQSKILKPLWSLVSVTLAAQVFTFPLGLYFFQQFPTWFLLTNMIVIPLSTICLYGGLVFLAFSWWTWAGTFIAIAFGFLIYLLNASVGFTEYLPQAVIQTSAWTMIEIVLLYAVIIFVLFALRIKLKRAVFGTLACLLILFVCIAAGKHQEINTREIDVFHINRGMAIGIVEDGKVTVLTDSATLADPEQINFHVAPRYKKLGVMNLDPVDLATTDSIVAGSVQYLNGFIFTPQQKIWIGNADQLPSPHAKPDVLIIHAKNFWALNALQEIETNEIVLTGEVKQKWKEKWMEEGKRRKIPVYVTGESGARVYTW
jgi:competence protein ComEC